MGPRDGGPKDRSSRADDGACDAGDARAASDPFAATAAAPSESFVAGRTMPVDSSAAPAPSLDYDLRPFGPFTAVERLAEQGAMGVVARGYNAAFDRWELLKFLHPELSFRPEFVRQFFREGRVLAKLSHPNIVQVYALYTLDGRPCLAMEFLEGESLSAVVARERTPVAVWYDLFLAAARGLAAAHDVGLLHRDLKPENLFVLRDRAGGGGAGGNARVKLIDFGLATADRSGHTDASRDPTLVAAMSGGTPLYMAPELWADAEATPRTDLYALGQSFFFALAGRLPFAADTLGQVRAAVTADVPFLDVRDLRPDVPAPLALVLARAIAKRPDDRIATADALVAALVSAAGAARPRRVPGSGPYRGLESYGAAERDVFFGRDGEVAEVLERLRAQPGVVLVGPSGSGKSSLAQAGVVPAIEDGALGGGLAYAAVRVEPGPRPVHALAAALARAAGSTEAQLLAFLGSSPARLGESLRAALPAGAGLVLVVDQLEELATLAHDPAAVAAFAAAVGSLLEVASAPVRVVATLRADLMDRLFALDPLRPLLTRGFYPVRPMGPAALREAMTGPALAADYRFEDPRVVDEVVADVARTTSGLPLLSFAMAAWWEARDEARRVLPTAAWRGFGGLTGALTRHGDRVLDAMTEEARAAAERMLVRLVSADRTRVRVARTSLVDPAAAGPGAAMVLERLLLAKLAHKADGEVELAHDALIVEWPRLRALLVSSGEDRAFRERVAAAAKEWDAQRRPDGALWSGEQAERLARWFHATGAPLDQLELAFVEAVRRRAARGRAAVRVAVAASVVTAVVYALVARSNTRELERRLAATHASLDASQAAFVRAETGRLDGLAWDAIAHDPAAALRLAARSTALARDGALDVLAWEVRARGVPVPLPGLEGSVESIAVSPTARWIAVAGGDAVEVLAAGGPSHALVRIPGFDPAVDPFAPLALAFGPHGDTLALASRKVGALVGEPPAFALTLAGRCDASPAPFAWPEAEALVAACRSQAGVLPGPSGAALTIAPDGGVELRVAPSAPPVRLDVAPQLIHSAWIRARDAVAVVTRGRDVRVVSLATGETVGLLPSPDRSVDALAADPSGQWLFAGMADHGVLAYDLDASTVAMTRAVAGSLASAACGLSPDAATFACGAPDGVALRSLARARGVVRADVRLPLPAAPDAVAPTSAGGPTFALVSGALTRDGQSTSPLVAHPTLLATADDRVAVAGTDEGGHPSIAAARAAFAVAVAPVPLPALATALGWSASGARVFVMTADRSLRVFDADPLREVSAAPIPWSETMRTLGASDDGRRVALGGAQGLVVVFSVAANEKPRVVGHLPGPVACLAFARAGRALVAASGRRVDVLDTDTGRSFTLFTAPAPVVDCQRSPDEDRFSFVDADGTAWVRALDLSDVADGFIPPETGLPGSDPAIATWRGLPTGLAGR